MQDSIIVLSAICSSLGTGGIQTMTSNKNIVLPIDFSELSLAALPWATRIATMLDARIHCIYGVVETHVYAAFEGAVIPMPTREELVANAESAMNSFVDRHMQEPGQDPVQIVVVGKPAEVIVDYAKSIDAQMIVMTTHGHGGFKRLFLGSTTEAVLRNADCPVLSVRIAE